MACDCEGKRLRDLNTQATFDSAMTLAVDKAGIDEVLQMAITLLSPWTRNGSDIGYTTGNVGIGTTSPSTDLEVASATATITINRDLSTAALVLRNDVATPGAATEMGRLSFKGNDDGGGDSSYAQVRGSVTDDTAGLEDGFMTFHTSKAGSVTEQMRIDNLGNVGIGATVSPSANGDKVLFFGDNTADPTMGANTAGFYGKDVAGTVEAFAVDEAGNAAQLTPHNFTLFTPDPSFEYPWSYYSKNKFIGKEINADIFGALRALETLTGQTFIHLQDLPIDEKLDWNEVEDEKLEESILRRKRQDTAGEPVEDLYIKKSIPDWMKSL